MESALRCKQKSTGLFLADCRAWQADFQRGMMAIQEFYAQRDGDSADKFAKLMLEGI